MSAGLWMDEKRSPRGPVGLSDAASSVDQLIRDAQSHWNETITSERASLAGRFRHLAAWWKRDSEFQSSPSRIALHSAYQQIIGMGREALPLILRDLEQTQAPWFWALQAISGEDPVRAEDRGYIDRMTTAWIRWGKQRKLV